MVFVRKVVRGSVKRFDYSLNFPKEVVERMFNTLSESLNSELGGQDAGLDTTSNKV